MSDAWARSQRREVGYNDSQWGIRHSRDYWMSFLKLDRLDYPVLEVGCGDSGLWRFDPQVHGLDPIDYSRLGGNFTLGVAESLPFKDGEYETALCVNALDHCADPAQAVREMRRVCKRLVLWTYIFPHEAYRALYHPHPHAFTLSQVSKFLEGMKVTHWSYVSPYSCFAKTSTTMGKLKLAAADALGVRAALIHAEETD